MQEETATEIAFASETGIFRNSSNSISQRQATGAVRQHQHARQTQAAKKASEAREELEQQIADLGHKIKESLAKSKLNAAAMTPEDLSAAVQQRNEWRKQRLDITESEEWAQVRQA
jgi:gamma-glutamyltranspeptidase